LKESGDKISSDLKKEIEEKVEDLKKVKDGDNMEDINNKTSELSQIIQKVGAELYKKSAEKKPEEDKGEKKDTEEGEYKEKS